jgi:tol-pal system protein YbgF
MRSLLAAALVGVVLAMAPSTGDAAWWPWQKKKDTATPQPAPTDIAPPADDAAAQADRLSRIESEMRTLTGQVEQLTYQVQQLQDQLQQLDTGKAGKRPPAVPAAPVAAPKPLAEAVPRAAADAGAVPPAAGPGTPPRPLGALTVDAAPAGAAADQPIDLTAIPRSAAGADMRAVPPPAAPPKAAAVPAAPAAGETVVASLGDPRAQYEQAYNSILAGDYDRAEAGFRAFLVAHPEDEHAADAQYWIGESLFARGKYREAANEFLNGHKTYPKSAKAPDTLLKLGLALAGLGERDAACSTSAQVLKQDPQASNALRQRIAVEQASASC